MKEQILPSLIDEMKEELSLEEMEQIRKRLLQERNSLEVQIVKTEE